MAMANVRKCLVNVDEMVMAMANVHKCLVNVDETVMAMANARCHAQSLFLKKTLESSL